MNVEWRVRNSYRAQEPDGWSSRNGCRYIVRCSHGTGQLIMVIGLSGARFGLIIPVITKLDDREAGIQFVNHEYDYRPTSDDMKVHYQLIRSITISDCKCPITRKCPISALIGGFIDQSDSREL